MRLALAIRQPLHGADQNCDHTVAGDSDQRRSDQRRDRSTLCVGSEEGEAEQGEDRDGCHRKQGPDDVAYQSQLVSLQRHINVARCRRELELSLVLLVGDVERLLHHRCSTIVPVDPLLLDLENLA